MSSMSAKTKSEFSEAIKKGKSEFSEAIKKGLNADFTPFGVMPDNQYLQ